MEERFKRAKANQQSQSTQQQKQQPKNTKSINRTTKTTAKKLPDGLHHRRRPTKKCRKHRCYKFYRTNHANTKKLRRRVEDTTGHQFDPIWNVIKVNKSVYIASRTYRFC